MPSQMLIIAGIAGVGVLAVKGQTPTPERQPIPSGPIGQRLRPSQLLDRRFNVRTAAPSPAGLYDPALNAGRFDVDGYGAEAREIQDKMLAAVKKEWDAMSGEARKKACGELKKQFPNDSTVQALDCDASNWENLVAVVGGAVGGAAGMAACGPPCAYVGAALGAAVGKVIGKEIGEFLEDAWESVEDNASDAVDYVTDLLSW